jgi:hypothetical protein
MGDIVGTPLLPMMESIRVSTEGFLESLKEAKKAGKFEDLQAVIAALGTAFLTVRDAAIGAFKEVGSAIKTMLGGDADWSKNLIAGIQFIAKAIAGIISLIGSVASNPLVIWAGAALISIRLVSGILTFIIGSFTRLLNLFMVHQGSIIKEITGVTQLKVAWDAATAAKARYAITPVSSTPSGGPAPSGPGYYGPGGGPGVPPTLPGSWTGGGPQGSGPSPYGPGGGPGVPPTYPGSWTGGGPEGPAPVPSAGQQPPSQFVPTPAAGSSRFAMPQVPLGALATPAIGGVMAGAFVGEPGTVGGNITGVLAGAAQGALIGLVVPGIGTAIGALGGAIGAAFTKIAMSVPDLLDTLGITQKAGAVITSIFGGRGKGPKAEAEAAEHATKMQGIYETQISTDVAVKGPGQVKYMEELKRAQEQYKKTFGTEMPAEVEASFNKAWKSVIGAAKDALNKIGKDATGFGETAGNAFEQAAARGNTIEEKLSAISKEYESLKRQVDETAHVMEKMNEFTLEHAKTEIMSMTQSAEEGALRVAQAEATAASTRVALAQDSYAKVTALLEQRYAAEIANIDRSLAIAELEEGKRHKLEEQKRELKEKYSKDRSEAYQKATDTIIGEMNKEEQAIQKLIEKHRELTKKIEENAVEGGKALTAVTDKSLSEWARLQSSFKQAAEDLKRAVDLMPTQPERAITLAQSARQAFQALAQDVRALTQELIAGEKSFQNIFREIEKEGKTPFEKWLLDLRNVQDDLAEAQAVMASGDFKKAAELFKEVGSKAGGLKTAPEGMAPDQAANVAAQLVQQALEGYRTAQKQQIADAQKLNDSLIAKIKEATELANQGLVTQLSENTKMTELHRQTLAKLIAQNEVFLARGSGTPGAQPPGTEGGQQPGAGGGAPAGGSGTEGGGLIPAAQQSSPGGWYGTPGAVPGGAVQVSPEEEKTRKKEEAEYQEHLAQLNAPTYEAKRTELSAEEKAAYATTQQYEEGGSVESGKLAEAQRINEARLQRKYEEDEAIRQEQERNKIGKDKYAGLSPESILEKFSTAFVEGTSAAQEKLAPEGRAGESPTAQLASFAEDMQDIVETFGEMKEPMMALAAAIQDGSLKVTITSGESQTQDYEIPFSA